jgi:hypothetical protein
MPSSLEMDHRTLVRVLNGTLRDVELPRANFAYLDVSTLISSESQVKTPLTGLAPNVLYSLLSDVSFLAKRKDYAGMRELKNALTKYAKTVVPSSGHPTSDDFLIEQNVLATLDVICFNAHLEQASIRRGEPFSASEIHELWGNYFRTPIRRFFRSAFPEYKPEIPQ